MLMKAKTVNILKTMLPKPTGRFSFKTYAVRLTDFAVISDQQLGIQDKGEKFIKMFDKIGPFKKDLVPVPSELADKSSYDKAVETNSKLVVEFIQSQAYKAVDIEQAQADFLCDPKVFYSSSSVPVYPYTNLLRDTADIWASFSPLFLKVISAKTQLRIAKRDQFKGLDLEDEDISIVETDIRKMNYLTSQFSQQTSTRDYIENTPKSEKDNDLKSLNVEISKASLLARICKLTVENIPTKYIFAALVAFKKNPKDKTSIDNLDKAIIAYKNTLIKKVKAAKKAGTTYDLDADLK